MCAECFLTEWIPCAFLCLWFVKWNRTFCGGGCVVEGAITALCSVERWTNGQAFFFYRIIRWRKLAICLRGAAPTHWTAFTRNARAIFWYARIEFSVENKTKGTFEIRIQMVLHSSLDHEKCYEHRPAMQINSLLLWTMCETKWLTLTQSIGNKINVIYFERNKLMRCVAPSHIHLNQRCLCPSPHSLFFFFTFYWFDDWRL